MVKEGKTAVVPRLRFPEFAGQALSEVRLSDVTAESSIRNGDGPPAGTVMGVSKVLGIVPMEERIVASDIARYKLVRKEWFAYNPMRLNIGSIARWHGDADILVSPDYVVFQCRDEPDFGIDPSYLDHFRQSAAWDAFVSEGGDGGVRLRNYYKDIARLELALPVRNEQQKIADCLTSLDELITAQRRKVEALKTYKRGLMQQLFPREGETFPRLRFPEFRDAPEWKNEQLDALAKRGSGHTPNKSIADYYNGGIKWISLADSKRLDKGLISQTSIEISQQGLDNSSAVLHPAGSVVLSRDAGIGKSAVMGMPMAVSQHFIVWTCHEKRMSNWFLYYVLQKMKPVFECIATGSTIKTIGVPFFRDMSVTTPSLPEQQRIAGCLLSCDIQIVAETDKIAAFKNYKNGLMQQLFPSLEEA